MPEKREGHFPEAMHEGAGSAIGPTTDNEAVKAIPVAGTVFKAVRGADDPRNKSFAAKIQRFQPGGCSDTDLKRDR